MSSREPSGNRHRGSCDDREPDDERNDRPDIGCAHEHMTDRGPCPCGIRPDDG